MLFNSFTFLLFFPIVTIIYFLLPHKYRWLHLLIASCVFYCFFIPIYILILLVTILIDYYAAIYIDTSVGKARKRWLVLSIISTCLVLFVFKYFNFFNSNFAAIARLFDLKYPVAAINIILPIGLSFHTFQSLSYVIEVYRGNQKPEKHFGLYSLYVMFYPQLVAGPIERPQNMIHQFREEHWFKRADVSAGLKQMLWGLFKKVVIADRLSLYVNTIYNNHQHHGGFSLALATVFFAFQIYCDFSGYSDIAIGSARVMGFKLMINFNRPYFAQSVSEFWKRWHISLSTWFKDYVYIPLGGNRVANGRKYFNLFITFLISGFWHGASWTYVIWGGLNGVYLIIPQVFYRLSKKAGNTLRRIGFGVFMQALNILITFVLIATAWICFRADSFKTATEIFHTILFKHGKLFLGDFTNVGYGISFIIILLIVELFEEYRLLNGFTLINNKSTAIQMATCVSLIVCILLFGVFDSSQFIYFQF